MHFTKAVASLFALLSLASGAKIPHWKLCAQRCRKNCKGKPDVGSCATTFIRGRCKPFGERIFNMVKTSCVDPLGCANKGMKNCNDLKCVLPKQCCRDAECPAGNRCISNWCAPKGNPSFTLTWEGTDDLNLEVCVQWNAIDYDGHFECITYSQGSGSETGGKLQHNDIPQEENAGISWQETVYFPNDGTAPGGEYYITVSNLHYGTDPATPFKVYVYEGDVLKVVQSGAVENRGNYFFSYTYVDTGP